MLLSPPQSQPLALNIRNYIPVSDYLHELIIVQRRPELVKTEFLDFVYVLCARTSPGEGHEPPVDLVGCAKGITALGSTGQVRTIAMLWKWLDYEKRARLMDPNQHTIGGATQYENLIASPLRYLEDEGVVVNRSLLYLRRWFPPARKSGHKRRCIILYPC